jgi:L-amino acid N-acyltransferase YncA
VTFLIRPATADDAESIAEIYNHYIRETIITFEEEPVSPEQIRQRLAQIARLGLPWIVAEPDRPLAGGSLLGYAYAGVFRERASYRHTVETAVYLSPGAQGQGIGTALYRQLLSLLQSQKLHRAIAGISLPNPASIRLHERVGFQYVGKFSQVGRKFNRWIDVGFWEIDLSPDSSIPERPDPAQ